MKSIPPPLPKRTSSATRPTPTPKLATSPTSATNGDSQSALMIGGLVAMLLLVLGLLIVIATLMKRDSAGVGQSGEIGQAGALGQAEGESESTSSQGSAKLGAESEGDNGRESTDAKDSDSEATPNEEPVKEPTAPEANAAGATPPDSPEYRAPGSETDSETKEAAEEALPAELPPGTRVIPLFSAPSAATAPKLEESNPFQEMGKANSVVFVIDKSSSMSGRLKRVIAALNQAIDKLDPKQSFQLIFFDDAPCSHPQLSGLIPATKRNKEKMTAWVESFVIASGGTEPLAAALQAIALKPDRIVILSDGEFNPAYVDSITKANSTEPRKRIRIDCIGLDEVVESLRQIAKQNGPGVYYQAR